MVLAWRCWDAGRDDALITAPNIFGLAPSGQPGHPGYALLYHAGPTGFGATTAVRLEGTVSGDLFGRCAAALDVRGDAHPDALVGSALASGDGGDAFGYIHVFESTASGTSTTPASRLRGAHGGDLLGSAIGH